MLRALPANAAKHVCDLTLVPGNSSRVSALFAPPLCAASSGGCNSSRRRRSRNVTSFTSADQTMEIQLYYVTRRGFKIWLNTWAMRRSDLCTQERICTFWHFGFTSQVLLLYLRLRVWLHSVYFRGSGGGGKKKKKKRKGFSTLRQFVLFGAHHAGADQCHRVYYRD